MDSRDQKGATPVATFGTTCKVDAAGEGKFETTLKVTNPKLWDTVNPQRYVAVTTVRVDGKVVDTYETPFGIRSIRYDAEKGFFLNGKHIVLNGVCNHHDLGALGAAFNTRAAERQLEILKGMGGNALRTSHNMPAPELLDLCDKMGILVMDESFDCWDKGKKPADYHLLFKDWHERDLRAEFRRDRNHPSVIMWSLGNEIPGQGQPEAVPIFADLVGIAHDEDPTRPSTLGANQIQNFKPEFTKLFDLAGENYDPGMYAWFHAKYPAMPFFSSETASTCSSRGVYFFPPSEGEGNFQVNSYDTFAPIFANLPDYQFMALDQNPFATGEFVWTGFDYLGEPVPYWGDITHLVKFWDDPVKQAEMEKQLKENGRVKGPARSSYFGIVDLCGFPKDRYYLYQARWRPDHPMVHLLPHWNWPGREGMITPVFVYTSGDEAELFLNGKSLGRRVKGNIPVPPPNLALNAKVSASSEASPGHAVASAVDGKEEGYWVASDTDPAQWLQVDLGTEKKIRQISMLFVGQVGREKYKLLGSIDGMKWRPLKGGEGPSLNGSSTRYGATSTLFRCDDMIRFLKVEFDPLTAKKPAWLAEVEVYERELPSTSSPYRLCWDDVVYEPGELKAVAYKGGKPWAEETVKTTGTPAALKLEVDRSSITGDGRDLAFVTARVVDAEGRTVPVAANSIRVTVEGAGELVATDNGDATDLTVFSAPERKAFKGLALAIVKAKHGSAGKFTLKAVSEGLEGAQTEITAK